MRKGIGKVKGEGGQLICRPSPKSGYLRLNSIATGFQNETGCPLFIAGLNLNW